MMFSGATVNNAFSVLYKSLTSFAARFIPLWAITIPSTLPFFGLVSGMNISLFSEFSLIICGTRFISSAGVKCATPRGSMLSENMKDLFPKTAQMSGAMSFAKSGSIAMTLSNA